MRISSGIVLGVGLGGFVDGILLHQILHWHNMGSAILPPTSMQSMQTNMRWDGYFHAATWAVTLVGVFMLRRDGLRRTITAAKFFAGELMIGWGLFNLVEGLIDHEILGLHHVRDLPVHVPAYDWLFLVIAGIGVIAIGFLLERLDHNPVLLKHKNAA